MMDIIKIISLLLISIAPLINGHSQSLPLGDWTGNLTPMNHPDMQLPMRYTISEGDDSISLTIAPENGPVAQARKIKITSDRLTFIFNETDANVELSCDFKKDKSGTYEGKCKDEKGKWGLFTMIPPSK